MNFRARIVVIITALVLAVLSGRYLYREAHTEATFTNAERGQSEVAILSSIGAPDEVLPCGEYLWWSGDQTNPPRNAGQCKKWVRYNFFLHAFAFGYSAEGKLVSRFEYSSE